MQTLYFCPVSFFFPRLISAVAEWMSIPYFGTWCGPSANLECRSEMCCTQLAENTGCKIRRLQTVAQSCRAISSQLRNVSTIGKNLLNSNISSRCPHNIANVLADWRLRSIYQFGPAQHIQRVSRLGSVVLNMVCPMNTLTDTTGLQSIRRKYIVKRCVVMWEMCRKDRLVNTCQQLAKGRSR